METKVFISFRFEDGNILKEELEDIFDSSNIVINQSEDVDRSDMSDDTIRRYIYDKLKGTSVTVLILTPKAIDYKKNGMGKYDDWLYDELRYSLQDRESNRTNGVIALYTDESKSLLLSDTSHTCSKCNKTKHCRKLLNFDNLARKNMLNIKNSYKYNPCDGLYDDENDSYISLIHIDDFKKEYEKYIDKAKEKRERIEEFNLVKEM